MRIGIDIDDTMTFIKDDLEQAAILYDISIGNSGKFLNDNYMLVNALIGIKNNIITLWEQ